MSYLSHLELLSKNTSPLVLEAFFSHTIYSDYRLPPSLYPPSYSAHPSNPEPFPFYLSLEKNKLLKDKNKHKVKYKLKHKS